MLARSRPRSLPAAGGRKRLRCRHGRRRARSRPQAGEFVMRGVTVWVTNAAVWVTGKVGDLVESTTSPDLTASWFEGQYGAMVAVAGALALLMLMLAVIQSVIRQDVGMLIRAAFGYLPMAFILAGVAIAATGLLVAITDDISARRRQRPRHQAVGQPPAGSRRRLQERARRELGDPAVRGLPRRDHPRNRSVRALARDDHPRRGDLHLRLLPPSHLRRDDLARDEPLGAAPGRAARRDHPLEVRHRLDPQSRHRGDRQHQRRRTATARRSSG